MASFDELETAWAQRAALPARQGTVKLLVVRVGDGEHEVPDRVRATRLGGIEGDRWASADEPDQESQITLMMASVAELIAGDQPLHLPGDNLLVDLDLHENNLPVGTRLRAGGAVLEVTPKLHTGCKKFSARFGQDALRWVNIKSNRPHRLRGLHCKVVEDGEIATGDAIVVLSE